MLARFVCWRCISLVSIVRPTCNNVNTHRLPRPHLQNKSGCRVLEFQSAGLESAPGNTRSAPHYPRRVPSPSVKTILGAPYVGFTCGLLGCSFFSSSPFVPVSKLIPRKLLLTL